MITKKQRDNEIRNVEIEFGFKVRYRNQARYVRLMAEEIHKLRTIIERKERDDEYNAGRVRQLEVQLADLEFKLRG